MPPISCTQGANAPLSGLVALLGAMHALKAAGASSTYTKRVVFLAVAGEPWGYMGSRRFLYEAATGSNATAGLDLPLIEKVCCLTHNPASLDPQPSCASQHLIGQQQKDTTLPHLTPQHDMSIVQGSQLVR